MAGAATGAGPFLGRSAANADPARTTPLAEARRTSFHFFIAAYPTVAVPQGRPICWLQKREFPKTLNIIVRIRSDLVTLLQQLIELLEGHLLICF
jgi:hypothetical protein